MKKSIISMSLIILVLFGCGILPENIIRLEIEEDNDNEKVKISIQEAMLLTLKEVKGIIISHEYIEWDEIPKYKIIIVNEETEYEIEISAINGEILFINSKVIE